MENRPIFGLKTMKFPPRFNSSPLEIFPGTKKDGKNGVKGRVSQLCQLQGGPRAHL